MTGRWRAGGNLSSLMKTRMDKCQQFRQRFAFILSICRDAQLGIERSGKHHQSHDTFAVNLPVAGFNENITAEPRRHRYKFGCCPGMKTEPVGDYHPFLNHARDCVPDRNP